MTCSPPSGMLVTIFQQCLGGTACQERYTCIPQVDFAEMTMERSHCELICRTHLINIEGILVNLPSGGVTICEISVL